jgi:hypothetical protein
VVEYVVRECEYVENKEEKKKEKLTVADGNGEGT